MSGTEFPDDDAGYELRFTRQALEDLRCSGLAPGDLDSVEATTPWHGIVRDFRVQRVLSPTSTEGSLRKMKRGDIYPLHGPAGGRAATWFDPDSQVCWFLGFSPKHDYKLLEARAEAGELLPDLDDETLLEIEREELDLEARIGPGLKRLVAQALDKQCEPARARVGALLRLEVTAVAEQIDGSEMIDLWLVCGVPVDGQKPPDWPGSAFLIRLAVLATGCHVAELELRQVAQIPTPDGTRQLDLANEVGIQICGWVP